MPSFAVTTASRQYEAIVERGALERIPEFLPEGTGRLFTVTTRDVWALYGQEFTSALAGRESQTLFFSGGEEHKRLAAVEALAEEVVALGGDRSSVVIGFGGGIVTDLAGFLAAIFMRGVPFLSVPTTLLAQVDAGVGGKTGANLQSGKNLIGAFHQPLAVLTDPSLLASLPDREYRAGLFEVLKCGVIRNQPLFHLLADDPGPVLLREPALVERMIAESVRIKCEVVSTDEKEHGLRRILNFGHTVGHAIEAETGYTRYLHGEAVGLGMQAAAWLSLLAARCNAEVARQIVDSVNLYGPLPSAADLLPERLLARLAQDKKTLRGTVHFVLATAIGSTEVVSGLDDSLVIEALRKVLK
jgi:3-dehydroquinate synthase